MSLLKLGFTKSKKGAAQSDSVPASTSAEKSDSNSGSDETAGSAELPKAAKRKKKIPIRKYKNEYLAFGFIDAGSSDLPLPMCLICDEKFQNSGMKPSHLKRHLERKHECVAAKPIEYFQRLKNERRMQLKDIDLFTSSELRKIKSSFAAALIIAKEKKASTIGERLVKPIMLETTRIMLGDAAAKKMESIPLSDTTVSRRITEMSQDVQSQLKAQLSEAVHFTLQFDESTDVSGEAILIGFVRYANAGKIVEELFCYISLPERTTGEEIFSAINNKMLDYELDWKNVVGVCTDGAAAMVGVKSGLVKRMAEIAHTEFISFDCVLHREALASKKLSAELGSTLEQTVKMINNIKARPLHSRIFAKICQDMDSEHETLLLHAEVRWLSRGKILDRVYELRKEMIRYFDDYMKPIIEKREKKRALQLKKGQDITEGKKEPEEIFLEHLRDDEWQARLAYLADIFALLSELNTKIQGRHTNCFKYFNKVEAFKKKTRALEIKCGDGQIRCVPFDQRHD